MKVGTLACILGAWSEKTDASKGLDIGTGTGLLALMMAQKNPDLHLDAVEIDPSASLQARENAQKSPWGNRIEVHNQDIMQFADLAKGDYDLIISNPPFFKGQFPAADRRVNIAKHGHELDLGQLAHVVKKMLHRKGSFFILLPPPELDFLSVSLQSFGIYKNRQLDVFNYPKEPVKAVAAEFSMLKKQKPDESVIIRTNSNHHTDRYRALMRPYYLHF